jgi:hypothetical protein
MSLNNIIGKVNFTPLGNGKSNIRMDIIVQLRRDVNGRIYATIPALGGLSTFADNDIDMDKAINEAVFSFFDLCKRDGKVIRAELTSLGWNAKSARVVKMKVPRDRMPQSLEPGSSLKSVKINVPANAA